MVNNKLKEWFKRYAAAEVIGLLSGIVFANISMFVFGNMIGSAFIATWAENFGFYGTILYKDGKQRKNKHGNIGFKGFLIMLKNTIIEFGPAEYLDSFLIRPFYLAVFPHFIQNYSLAIILGSLATNITYYIPTILSYEFRKKVFKE
ncbi:MAG: hypothetical protein ABIG89_02330 [Candidatus Woesearchaeota archaeon]